MAVNESFLCMRWIPCCSNRQKSPLQRRICSYLHMSPGLLTLSASITGIICVFIWSSPYLSIPFGLGIVSSAYLIYLGYTYQSLKDFSENNVQLETSISDLKRENDLLRQQVERLEQTNQELKDTSEEMQQLVDQFRDEHDTLSQENKKLKQAVSDLEEINKSLVTTLGKNIQDLGNLSEILIRLQNSVEKDHSQFAEDLGEFKQAVESLKTTRDGFDKTQSRIDKKMQKQVEALVDVTTLLNAIFCKINEWKDSEFIKHQIELQQMLAKQLNELIANIAKNQGALEEQDKQIHELAKLKKGFKKSLDDLLDQIANLKMVKAELSNEVENVRIAAQILQNYELKVNY